MLIRYTDRADVVNTTAFKGALNVPSYTIYVWAYIYVCLCALVIETINSKDLYTHMSKQLSETSNRTNSAQTHKHVSCQSISPHM